MKRDAFVFYLVTIFAILFTYLTSPKKNTSADRHTLEMYELNLISLPFLAVKVNFCEKCCTVTTKQTI